ncbi:berberine bridge enzyme-like 17 [Abrus precatorius]|uniref:Berberine bridge enzyme-like 17 n=1 Tax=Abrus precatorius TaxID=3816 RepID=A0A8B8KWN7_ABRPR|nr:berberine bridge enzyme-like 17 [Abrus precatorius]
METKGLFSFLLTSLTIMLCFTLATSQCSPFKKFLFCLSQTPNSNPSNPCISQVLYTSDNTSFSSILNMHVHNNRFKKETTPKPLVIITAQHESHVQATVTCAKANGIQIRIRSGGHDYEGLSYVSDVPFVILDMFPLQSVDVDTASATAWVQAGATLGQVYYRIAEKSKVHAFPAGVCITLGAGGHFSGGGYGNLMRKYGLSVDNIIDAKLVDANGTIHDRQSMGEDLFWAIRGGGGASFGVILAWKIKLVSVPEEVTVFRVKKTVAEGATDVVYKWQQVAAELHEDLFIRVQVNVVNGTVQLSFIGLFLGQFDGLAPLVNEKFPELGLKQSDCTQMPWINTTLFWADLPIDTPIEALLSVPKEPPSVYFKAKSDYVKKPIPKEALNSLWNWMIKGKTTWMQWNPYGGKMEQIAPSETPFPHRAGNLFLIQYFTFWTEDDAKASDRYLHFSRSLHKFMTPYVSNSPREAFLNYRDIDIGAKHPSTGTSLDEGRTYGSKLFKENFDRLVSVKTKVDPDNFFSYEQSIPPTSSY